MSKYFEKKFVSDIGHKIIKPNIDEETKNFIISNLVAGNFNIIFDKITPDMSLSFTDNENNSLIHLLLLTNDKLIPEETKIKLINIFVKKGAPINTYNKQKLTPLHIAINNGNDKIVKLLLEKGANPNAVTNNNLLPIHLALKKNIGLCRELIIPKNIGDIEKKNKNELKNIIHNKIIDIFNRDIFSILNIIFEDYTEILKDNEYDKIKSEILELVKDDDNPKTISYKLDNKIMSYLQLISKKYDIEDNNINIDKNADINVILQTKLLEKYNNHASKIELIKNNYESLRNHVNSIILLIDEMINNTIKNIIRLIIRYPNHVNNNFANPELLIIFPLNNQNGVNKGIVNVRNYSSVLNGIKYENVIPIVGRNIINRNFNILNVPDQILLQQILNGYTERNFTNTEFLPKLKGLFYVLNNLNKLKIDLINNIDMASFDILDPVNNNIISLKSVLLNTLKLYSISQILTGSFKELKIYKLIGVLNGNNVESLQLDIPQSIEILDISEPVPAPPPGPVPARLPVIGPINLNPQLFQIIRETNNPRANPRNIARILQNVYNLYDIQVDINNFDSHNRQLSTGAKQYLDNIVILINEVNTIKYFINFVRENNLYPAENDIMDNYLTQYFDKNIDIRNVTNTKFKNNRNINIGLSPILIQGVDDDIVEYNQPSNKFKYYKIFRNDEKNIINRTLNILNVPNDVLFYNNYLGENNIVQNIDIFNNIPTANESYNYLFRDDTIRNRTVDNDVFDIIKNKILIEIYNQILDNTDPKKTKFKEINDILPKYELNGFSIELLLEELIKFNTNKIISLLLKYYAMHHSKYILKLILDKIEIKNYFINNESLNINLNKLTGINFEFNKDFSIDESENPENLKFNFNYNYFSNDEANLCYKNKKNIIDILLKLPTTNYFVKDKDGNTILHYLINLENYNLFQSIYSSNYKVFTKLKNTPNVFNKKPIDILNEKIGYNNKNMYKSNPVEGLIFSEIYSDELFVKLKNNNELSSIIPDNIKSIYNDLYLLFNLENINTDIFNGITINNYSSLFSYNKNNIWSLSQISNINNISEPLYNYLQQRYDIKNKSILNNEFIKRFYNSIVHLITLHLTNVFFQLLKKWLIDNNIEIIIPGPKSVGPSKAVSNIGVTKKLIDSLQKELFEFDNTYIKQNVGQMIVINLYKIKYNDEIKQNETFSTLKEILKSKINLLYQNIESEKEKDFNDNIEKIYDYMNTYFESFNKKLVVFLTNYVKFVELQYNLQKIKELII
jgi:hypothetical protein